MEEKKRRRRKKKRMSKKRRQQILFLRTFIVIICAVWLVGAFIVWKKYGPTKETYDLNTYFGIESEEQVGVTIDNEVLGAYAMEVDGHIYLSYEVVRDYLNSRFYWDPNENILLYTLIIVNLLFLFYNCSLPICLK